MFGIWRCLYVFNTLGTWSLQAARNQRRSPFLPMYAKDQRCSWRGYNLFGASSFPMLFCTQAWYKIWIPGKESQEGKPEELQACSFWVLKMTEAKSAQWNEYKYNKLSAQNQNVSSPFYRAWISVHCSSAAQGGFVLFLRQERLT